MNIQRDLMFIVKYCINIAYMPTNSSKKFDIENFFLIAAEIWKDNCETYFISVVNHLPPLPSLSSMMLFFKCAPGLQIRKFMLF